MVLCFVFEGTAPIQTRTNQFLVISFSVYRTVPVTNATELFNLLLTVAHAEHVSDYVSILLLDAKYDRMAPLDFEYCTMVIGFDVFIAQLLLIFR